MTTCLRLVAIAMIACAKPDDSHELVANVDAIAAWYRPLLDVAVLRIDLLKLGLRGNLPGSENALRIAESANDELGLPPFTQTQPPGPEWRPSPASLLGIAPFALVRAAELARDGRCDELRHLVQDESMRYATGILVVNDRLTEVEAWLAAQRTLTAP